MLVNVDNPLDRWPSLNWALVSLIGLSPAADPTHLKCEESRVEHLEPRSLLLSC